MDNYYKGCPPKMSDGRHLTDYQPHTQLEERIKYINGISRDDEARLFLQANANKIMSREWDFLKKTRSCWLNECVHNYPVRMYPPWFAQEMRNYNSTFVPGHTPFKCAQHDDFRMTVV
jgi:hypothetical protein